MRPSGYRRHLCYFHIPPGGHVSIVDTKRGVRMAEQVAYNIDCMEYMRTLTDKFFDTVCLDLSEYAKPGDKILDTHLGSGSSRLAARDAGLDFVGCEIDKEYFDKHEERWAAYTAQLRMW